MSGVELRCAMTPTCREPVTHLGAKGYIYCATHGDRRRRSGFERVRRLKPDELATLRRGEQVERY